jgi:hypothetical protein
MSRRVDETGNPTLSYQITVSTNCFDGLTMLARE